MEEVREPVKWFAEQMENKLKENDNKGGWDDCNLYWLVNRIKEEVSELERAINIHRDLGDNRLEIIRESADISNFSMMIADIARRKLQG
jgi:NTP pyrophosphatase (non-canonical NTP hydrolase)